MLELVYDLIRYNPGAPFPSKSEPIRLVTETGTEFFPPIQSIKSGWEESCGPGITWIKILPYTLTSVRILRVLGRVRLF